MSDVLEKISRTGILPVIKIERLEDALPLAAALQAGGINAIEVTVRNAVAYDAIRAISRSYPDMIVGAGTIRSRQMVDEAAAAGARYVVAPGFDPDVVSYCVEKGIPIVPGCTTATEIDAAVRMGLQTVKFFPASTCGGTAAIKLLSGPYPQVWFVPTGGVDFTNLEEYLRLDAVAAVGGSFMAKADLIRAGEWGAITANCRKALKLSLGFELAHVGLNNSGPEQALENAGTMDRLFGLGVKDGGNSAFCGQAVEFMKIPYYGEKGHIGFYTNSVRRALAWFEDRGIPIRPESLRVKDGKPEFFYLQEEVGGFAVHVVKR